MQITNLLHGLQQYGRTTTDKVEPSNRKDKSSATTSSGDSVRLSADVRLVDRARSEAMDAPEVRAEKVDRLKNLVDSGQYVIDTRKIAEKLVQQDLELLL